jgi:BolA protein
MTTAELMQQKLSKLNPQSLEILDESSKHVGHEGARAGGGHYQLVIVSG